MASQSVPRRVAIVCADVIGERMAGPAIRAVELGRALAKHFDVVVAASARDAIPDLGQARFVPLLTPLVDELSRESDVIIVQGNVLARWPVLRKSDAVLVADLYCPVPLELIEQGAGAPVEERMRLSEVIAVEISEQLRYADHFLCASHRQIDLWLGALMVLGRVNPQRFPHPGNSVLESLFTVVPFGVPDVTPPVEGNPLRSRFGLEKRDFVLLWGGGIYDWFDPVAIIRAIDQLRHEGLRTHLVFLGGVHIGAAAVSCDAYREARRIARQLRMDGDLVHFGEEWIPYEERYGYFADADIGVVAHHQTLETRYSFRTRVLDYLWAGLPVLTTQGDHFADLADREGFGKTVPYGDVGGWAEAIRSSTDATTRQKMSREARRVAGTITWSQIAEPLVSLCLQAEPAPDRVRAREVGTKTVRPRALLSRVRSTYARGGTGAIFLAAARWVSRQLR